MRCVWKQISHRGRSPNNLLMQRRKQKVCPISAPEPLLVADVFQPDDYAQWQKESDERIKGYQVKLRSRLCPESIYGDDSGEITVPRYGPSLEQEIRGGLDMPSTYARVLTLSEIEQLQKDQRRAENELLQREASCRICDATFRPGVSDV